jgi:hypothetical protein
MKKNKEITKKIVSLKKEISDTYAKLENEVSGSIYGDLNI